MIHLVTNLPLSYHRTLCRTLHDACNGAFIAWFDQRSSKEFPVSAPPPERFNHHYLSDVGFMKFIRAVYKDPDAVVILSGWSSSLALRTLLLVGLRRKPVFIWADHPLPRKRNRVFAVLRKLYLRLLERAVVVGFLACGNETVEHLSSLRIKRVFNFPCWVDLPCDWSLPPACREGVGPEMPLRLLVAGRMIPVKGFEVALEALALANRSAGRIASELTIVGEGSERQSLQTLAHSLNVANCVTFTGWLDDEGVVSAISASDVVLVPSRFEPYGVIVLEAMSNGRPVLASDQVIAAKDRDDQTSAIYFHAVGDAQCLANQIAQLAHSRRQLELSARAARATAEKWPASNAASMLSDIFAQTAAHSSLFDRAEATRTRA